MTTLLPERPRPERFALVVELAPHDLPAIVRLRRCLKWLLRVWGVRVRSIREVRDA